MNRVARGTEDNGRRTRHRSWAPVLALLAACGSATTAPSLAPQLSVGGSYPTTVSVVAGTNTCGAVTVQDNLTTIAQSPGSTSFTLAHTSINTTGTIGAGGAFTTSPTTLAPSNASYVVTIAGTFRTTGLTAVVHLDVTQASQPTRCSYDVNWTATKSGAANVIP